MNIREEQEKEGTSDIQPICKAFLTSQEGATEMKNHAL